MSLKTRQPTGKPPWPIMLIAGQGKAGKSYASAEASASKLIHRTFWFSVGEDDPDELGAIPDVRFEIVLHDGTYRSILHKMSAAAAEPPSEDGRPNLIVLDSGSRQWELISDMAQAEANARRKKPGEDAPISMDLWNVAKNRWQAILGVLRRHHGPSIITARMEEVTLVDKEGKPTKDRADKIKAEKSLPFEVGVVVEMPERGKAFLSGVRSVRMREAFAKRRLYPDFTVEKLWTDLGLAEDDATAPREFTATDAEASATAEAQLPVRRRSMLEELAKIARAKQISTQAIANRWAQQHQSDINETEDLWALEAFIKEIREIEVPK